MFYQKLLQEASFFSVLLRIDEDLAAQVREAGCCCGGVLHFARFRRKPRGGPPGLSRELSVRHSLCCSREGCRRRATPPSVLFLGRKVFFGVVVLLAPILREGLTPARFRRLEEALPVSRRTVQRWRRWWREAVPATSWWQRVCGQMSRAAGIAAGLPAALLAALAPGGQESVLAALRLLAPLAASAGVAQRSG
jgi:hypothetical protein